jgi:hypothetical protein
VPYWPGVPPVAALEQLGDVLKADMRNARRLMLRLRQGPVLAGQGPDALTKMIDVAEQQGDLETRDRLLEMVKKRIEEWFSGRAALLPLRQGLGTVVPTRTSSSRSSR